MVSQDELDRAREDGRRDALKGLGPNDYPFEYADGPLRGAWIEGWHEGKEQETKR